MRDIKTQPTNSSKLEDTTANRIAFVDYFLSRTNALGIIRTSCPTHEEFLVSNPEQKSNITVFDSAGKTTSTSAENLLKHFALKSGQNFEIGDLIAWVILFERYIKNTQLTLTDFNCARLICTALLFAKKTHNDSFYSNRHSAKLTGVSLTEMNVLESHFFKGFLGDCQHGLYIASDEYDRVCNEIEQIAERNQQVQQPHRTGMFSSRQPIAPVSNQADTDEQQAVRSVSP